jgi:hypothetical protein
LKDFGATMPNLDLKISIKSLDILMLKSLLGNKKDKNKFWRLK